MRQAAYRWHDFYLGLVMEQRKSTKDDKGTPQGGQTPLRENTDALVDGGFNRSSDEDSVMESERRVGIIQLELPLTTSVKGRRTKGVTAKEYRLPDLWSGEPTRKSERIKEVEG